MAPTSAEILAVRERLGWTQARLAAELGVSANYIAMCERGLRALDAGRWRLFLLTIQRPVDAR